MKRTHKRPCNTGRARGNVFSYREGRSDWLPSVRFSTGSGFLKEDTYSYKKALEWKAHGKAVRVIDEYTGIIKEVM